jgi:hypothetical protein
MTGPAVGLLDWRDARHFDRTGDRPCVLCHKPTPLRSHDGEAVHKVCAELWMNTHPDATRFHSDDDTPPAQPAGTGRHRRAPSSPRTGRPALFPSAA